MKTATTKPTRKQTKGETTNAVAPIIPQENYERLDLSLIDAGRLNYRKTFKPQSLSELAEDIARHGVISAVTVRPAADGRYELVIGERRYKAAAIAGLSTIPAVIRNLTDEEVTELQLAENMQREDPHPLEEAQAVAILQAAGKNIEEIALRMGKSKAFVYNRIKVAQLIEPLQELFLQDKMTLADAIEIASLAADAQQEFFGQQCNGSGADNFRLYNTSYAVARYKCDLKRAPFDTKDKMLIAEAGDCTKCPFNSATLHSLFPETAKAAVCSNPSCFKAKCSASLKGKLLEAVALHQPAALIVPYRLPDHAQELLNELPETVALPRYEWSNVNILTAPQPPAKDDYADEDGVFDEQGYHQEMEEYHADLEEYQTKLAESGTLKGLYLQDCNAGTFEGFYFNTERSVSASAAPGVTAKQVQEAIKEGAATPELLQAEITRINTREARAKELDAEKIQLAIHEQFSLSLADPATVFTLTAADAAAVRLIVYQSLGYSTRYQADQKLFGEDLGKGYGREKEQQRYEQLGSISNEQLCCLIRMAVANKSESKLPGHINAQCLYSVAAEAGVDVISIEAAQQNKAAERETKLLARIADLEKRIAELQNTVAA